MLVVSCILIKGKTMQDKKVFVLNAKQFAEVCEAIQINDRNVNDFTDYAFVSILEPFNGFHDCGYKHYFHDNHPNVINLEFYDVDEEFTHPNGFLMYPIDDLQADKLIDFIEANKGRNFYVHCDAGISRSQGVRRFLEDFYDYEYDNPDKGCPNQTVYNTLKQAFYLKYHINPLSCFCENQRLKNV